MFVEMAAIYTGQTVFFAESLDTFLTDLRRARPTAELFGVSRMPVRMAFRTLEQEGLLVRFGGRGFQACV